MRDVDVRDASDFDDDAVLRDGREPAEGDINGVGTRAQADDGEVAARVGRRRRGAVGRECSCRSQ